MLIEGTHCKSDQPLVLYGKGMGEQGSTHTLEVRGVSTSASQARGQENSSNRYKNLNTVELGAQRPPSRGTQVWYKLDPVPFPLGPQRWFNALCHRPASRPGFSSDVDFVHHLNNCHILSWWRICSCPFSS